MNLRKCAAANRGKYSHHYNETKQVLVPALLEIAHALSRGRKPATCSVLPGQNLQDWLCEVFNVIQDYGVRDYMDEKCSYVTELYEDVNSCSEDPDTPAIRRAIKLCRSYVRPRKIPNAQRGDYAYQKSHPVTNLKRKRAWYARQQGQGSHYDDFHLDYCDDFF